MKTEKVVRERYREGAQARVTELCCPVSYDARYLAVIPPEVIEKDYGCGDPSRYLKPGETVLDLGSGTGKICFIASQVVGSEGRVIGIDMTDDMLTIARRHAPSVASAIGYANVTFHKGRIQDLALDLEVWEKELAAKPIKSVDGFLEAEDRLQELRRDSPMIPDRSIDVVVSNCVLNLVDTFQRRQLFREIHRVLKEGGRAVISDIVSDETVPASMKQDPELWSGCLSGAFREDAFLQAFDEAGFHGLRILNLEEKPWRTIEGIEFRSMTIEATKSLASECLERRQAVIYRGPFKKIITDEGKILERGKRYAVCDKTFRMLQKPPYDGQFISVPPREEIPESEAPVFDCSKPSNLRSPRETKGEGYRRTETGSDCCGNGGETSCC